VDLYQDLAAFRLAKQNRSQAESAALRAFLEYESCVDAHAWSVPVTESASPTALSTIDRETGALIGSEKQGGLCDVARPSAAAPSPSSLGVDPRYGGSGQSHGLGKLGCLTR